MSTLGDVKRSMRAFRDAFWRERWGIIVLVYGSAALVAYGWLLLETL